MKTPARSEIQ